MSASILSYFILFHSISLYYSLCFTLFQSVSLCFILLHPVLFRFVLIRSISLYSTSFYLILLHSVAGRDVRHRPVGPVGREVHAQGAAEPPGQAEEAVPQAAVAGRDEQRRSRHSRR
jgi:hypothetical protein